MRILRANRQGPFGWVTVQVIEFYALSSYLERNMYEWGQGRYVMCGEEKIHAGILLFVFFIQ